jgi:hypothetical protein
MDALGLVSLDGQEAFKAILLAMEVHWSHNKDFETVCCGEEAFVGWRERNNFAIVLR